jgi:hypothetical protein
MTRRELLFRLSAIALSLALTLAAGELLLRLAGPGPRFARTSVEAATDGRFPDRPNFRDRSSPGPKATGSFRLLVLGDSFPWGSGVHPRDAFPRRLEGRLADLDSELDFEVVNWSRWGWNSRQAWESVRPVLADLQPDLVLLSFTLNDSEPSDKREMRRMIRPLQRRTPGPAWSSTLHRHSALYRALWERLESRRQRRAFTAYYTALFRGPHWDDCLEAMAELRAATRAMATPMVLVVWPVFDSQLDSSYAYRRLHRKLAAAAGELEIPVLDLLATFRRIDTRRLAVVPHTDPHPNELAHRIAADELTNHLIDEGLVPASYGKNQRRIMAVRRR